MMNLEAINSLLLNQPLIPLFAIVATGCGSATLRSKG